MTRPDPFRRRRSATVLPFARPRAARPARWFPFALAGLPVLAAMAVLFAPVPGEGKNSWLTGTGAWSFVVASQSILGVKPDFNGLRIDPCIPKKWKGFSVHRKFRGVEYSIVVSNPKSKCKGVKSLVVDGKKIEGNLIPLPAAGTKFVTVEVTLG